MIADILADAYLELVHLNSPWLRTLRGLWPNPGELAERYVVGERAPLVSPVRFFLISVGAFFLLNAIIAKALLGSGWIPAPWLPIAFLAATPVMAFLLHGVFSKSGRTIGETTCFVLYLMPPVFFYLGAFRISLAYPTQYWLRVGQPGPWISLLADGTILLMTLAPALYIGAASARFFQRSVLWSIVASFLITFAMPIVLYILIRALLSLFS